MTTKSWQEQWIAESKTAAFPMRAASNAARGIIHEVVDGLSAPVIEDPREGSRRKPEGLSLQDFSQDYTWLNPCGRNGRPLAQEKAEFLTDPNYRVRYTYPDLRGINFGPLLEKAAYWADRGEHMGTEYPALGRLLGEGMVRPIWRRVAMLVQVRRGQFEEAASWARHVYPDTSAELLPLAEAYAEKYAEESVYRAEGIDDALQTKRVSPMVLKRATEESLRWLGLPVRQVDESCECGWAVRVDTAVATCVTKHVGKEIVVAAQLPGADGCYSGRRAFELAIHEPIHALTCENNERRGLGMATFGDFAYYQEGVAVVTEREAVRSIGGKSTSEDFMFVLAIDFLQRKEADFRACFDYLVARRIAL